MADYEFELPLEKIEPCRKCGAVPEFWQVSWLVVLQCKTKECAEKTRTSSDTEYTCIKVWNKLMKQPERKNDSKRKR